MIFFNPCKIFFSFTTYSIFKIFFNIVVSYDSICSKIILCKNMNSILFILSDFIEHNQWIRANCLNTILTFLYFTQLNFSSISSIYSHTWTFNLTYFASNNLWFSIYTLKINSTQLTSKNIRVLNYHSVVSFRNYMHSSFLEV